MELKLKLSERLHLTDLLPLTGAYENIILSKSIKNKIEITATEVEEYDIKTVGAGLSWNTKGVDSRLELILSKKEEAFMSKIIKEASDKEALPMDLIEVYELFHVQE